MLMILLIVLLIVGRRYVGDRQFDWCLSRIPSTTSRKGRFA
jgi:hypothetical protein